MNTKSQPDAMPYLNQEAIRYTEGNIPIIEYRSKWYGHHNALTKDVLENMLRQYQKDNPDHEEPYIVFATDYPEQNSWGWSLVPKVFFDQNYVCKPELMERIEDEFVSVASV